ncbi:acyl-CoA dehydrogenase family protein [Myxococcota bacterium]|nr:acyl-CoA dehydrogenase family protein [Myxococcota bacterium]
MSDAALRPPLPPLDALAPDSDQADVVGALCDSLDRLGHGLDARAIDREHRVPLATLGELAELGMMGLSLPVEHGGYGFGLWATGSAVARLARYDRSVATTVGLHLGLGSRGLVRFADPALQADTLPQMATGETLAAFAATEPDAGSDLGGIRTKATLEPDGKLRLDGSKVYVTNGGLADLFTIVASSPGLGGARRGQTLFLLRKDDPGVQVGAEEEKLGLRGSSTTTVNLDEVRVGPERIIGQPGQGREHLAHILAWGRTAMAAGCCGTGHAAVDAALRHCAVRTQFGRPLQALPVVADQLEQAHALLFAMEALVRHAGCEEEALEARSLAAKIHASEGSWELADLAVQLHGGAGFVEETGVALLLRDARITRIFEGANDVLRIHLGLLLAGGGAPRQPLVEQLAPLEADSPRERLAVLYEQGSLGELARDADDFSALVERAALDLRTTLGARLGGAHLLLHGLGSLGVLRHANDAAVLRAAHAGTGAAEALAARWLSMSRLRSLSLHQALADGLRRQVRRPTPPAARAAAEVIG